MRTLETIQKFILERSAKVLTDDGRLISELLWEILQRLDAWIFSSLEVLDHILRADITTAQTLIYSNNARNLVTVKIYNNDPAQTVYIGKNGVSIVGPGVPVFHESSQSFTIDSGDSLYGIVELGTVDIRYAINMIL